MEDLLKRMTLDEKIGQMTQVEKDSIKLGRHHEVLHRVHLERRRRFASRATRSRRGTRWWKGIRKKRWKTRLAIPIIYGVDAVHGHGNLLNATIFPHNIGLGATNNPELVEKIGRATAEEILATGIHWNFSPVVAVVQDVRWGRTLRGIWRGHRVGHSVGNGVCEWNADPRRCGDIGFSKPNNFNAGNTQALSGGRRDDLGLIAPEHHEYKVHA
ncbi:MAG: hypothetical protein M0C28_19440 [Candidatus Moduliflexus flocculans]|nr:hypothetical protein [Candidatus Moduliflexus flocculans]